MTAEILTHSCFILNCETIKNPTLNWTMTSYSYSFFNWDRKKTFSHSDFKRCSAAGQRGHLELHKVVRGEFGERFLSSYILV